MAFSPITTNDHSRRRLLQWTAAAASVSAASPTLSRAKEPDVTAMPGAKAQSKAELRAGMVSYMVAHEQFPVPTAVRIGKRAVQAGFHGLATSDHLQPWQANEGHAGAAWVSLGALRTQVPETWLGTTVTCPTFRYSPAVVAEAFASLSLLAPGRVFLGVGSGEALNERAATGQWPHWQERWDRLIEAIDIIRALWTGNPVSHRGRYYNVEAKLYDPPQAPIPLLTAANGRKSMRLAGQHGDGLVTDPETWKQHKAEWQAGARDAGKNPDEMPVLVEQYVAVGGEAEARQAAELWRFGPKAFRGYYDITDPAKIQQRADAEISLQKAMNGWPVSADPGPHIDKIQELQESGVSIVNIHAGQADQDRVIDFYGEHVLPKVRTG
jgi:F420-dependent hydroxymycolic acid dehydrogenase